MADIVTTSSNKYHTQLGAEVANEKAWTHHAMSYAPLLDAQRNIGRKAPNYFNPFHYIVECEMQDLF